MSKIIPNSFQTPNLYIDQLLPLLLDSELRVLLYITRRTLGFLKRQDRVSLSQIVNGIVADGEQLDYGAGVSESAAKTALRSLVELGVLRQTAPAIAARSLPPEWEPQWDETKIEWAILHARRTEKKSGDKERLAKRRLRTPGAVQQGEGLSVNPGAIQQGEGGAIQQGEGGAIQQPPQKPVETQLETQRETSAQDHPVDPATLSPSPSTSPSAAVIMPALAAPTEPAIELKPIQASSPTPPVAAPLPTPLRQAQGPAPTIGVVTTGDPLVDQAVARGKGEWNRRDKRHLDDLVKQVTGLGMTMTDFRAMVDAFLDKYGRREMAALDTDLASKTLAKAQDAVLSLCGIDARFRSVAGLEAVFVSWRENDYRGATLPDGGQLVEHAGKMKAGAIQSNLKGQTPHASQAQHRNPISGGRPEQPAYSAGPAATDFSRYNRNRANRQPTTGA